MANKRYDQFTAGSFGSVKIFLIADPTTGALTKITLQDILDNVGIDDVLAVGQGLTNSRFLYTGEDNNALFIGDNVGGRAQLDISPSVSTIEISTRSVDANDNRSWMGINNTNSNSDFLIYANYDDSPIEARIAGTAVSSGSLLTYSADAHTFNGNVAIVGIPTTHVFNIQNLPQYANNGDAIIGGLVAGDVYYTNSSGDGILKIVI